MIIKINYIMKIKYSYICIYIEYMYMYIIIHVYYKHMIHDIYTYNILRKFFNSHLFWLNSHPFFTRSIICRLNLSVSAPPPCK
jgi:hypothetical protein